MIQLSPKHRFDLEIGTDVVASGKIELLVEELPESLHFASNCMSSVGCVSTGSMCYGPGCMSSVGCVGSMGSIVSSAGGGE